MAPPAVTPAGEGGADAARTGTDSQEGNPASSGSLSSRCRSAPAAPPARAAPAPAGGGLAHARQRRAGHAGSGGRAARPSWALSSSRCSRWRYQPFAGGRSRLGMSWRSMRHLVGQVDVQVGREAAAPVVSQGVDRDRRHRGAVGADRLEPEPGEAEDAREEADRHRAPAGLDAGHRRRRHAEPRRQVSLAEVGHPPHPHHQPSHIEVVVHACLPVLGREHARPHRQPSPSWSARGLPQRRPLSNSLAHSPARRSSGTHCSTTRSSGTHCSVRWSSGRGRGRGAGGLRGCGRHDLKCPLGQGISDARRS